MKLYVKLLIIGVLIIGFTNSCGVHQQQENIEISGLRFIGERIIETENFKGTVFGGISSIDYYNENWYAICDDSSVPIRFYTLHLKYDASNFYEASVKNVTFITVKEGSNLKKAEAPDPESLRFDAKKGTFIWTSEGQINKGINPSIKEMTINGRQKREWLLPKMFAVSKDPNKGPRHNGSLEGLSLSASGNELWLGMELPLLQDGSPPKVKGSYAPVRITLLNKKSGQVQKQYAYMLDDIPRNSKPAKGFKVNGLVELLALNSRSLLVLERAFASGWNDGGNNVRIYKIDIAGATDIKGIEKLKAGNLIPVKKKLIFDPRNE